MPVLFEVESGRPAEPGGLHIDDAHRQAEELLGADTFRSFNACVGSRSRAQVAEMARALCGVTLGLHDMLTINKGEDARTVLGFDLVRGKAGAAGTVYERPVASNADVARRGGLEGKSFGYVPLDGTVDIGESPERRIDLAPGQVLLPEDAQHSVHIPSGQLLLELIMTHNEPGASCEAEWSAYSAAQPNPNV